LFDLLRKKKKFFVRTRLYGSDHNMLFDFITCNR
jgi:hypothetical protein